MQDVSFVNDNYLESYQDQLIKEIDKIDSKLADDLRQKSKQSAEGINLKELGGVILAVAVVGVVVLLIRKQK